MNKKGINQKVKLAIYNRTTPKEIEIEYVEAFDWDNFILLVFDDTQMSLMDMEPIVETIRSNEDEKIIIVPKRLDLQIYGIKPEKDYIKQVKNNTKASTYDMLQLSFDF